MGLDKEFWGLFGGPLPVSNDAVVVYLILRSDIARNETPNAKNMKGYGELVSGLDVPTIALRAGIPELSVWTAIEALVKLHWVKKQASGFRLGTKQEFESEWYCDGKIATRLTEKKVVTDIRKMADDKKKHDKKVKREEKISAVARQKLAAESLGGLVRPEKASTTILNHLKGVLNEKFDCPLEHDPRSRYVYVGRILKWCSEDIEAVKKLIDWTAENWGELQEVLNCDEDVPNLKIFGSKAYFTTLKKYMLEGIPKPISKEKVDRTGMATRANPKEIKDAKNEGW